MDKVFKYIMSVMAALGLGSCIYPFTPEGVEEEVGLMVMEGDILLGEISTFIPSRSISLINENERTHSVELSNIYIEAEDGTVTDSYSVEESEEDRFQNNLMLSYKIDTRNMTKLQKYRLVFSVGDKTYTTTWMDYVPTPPIDSITYSIPEDKQSLEIKVHSTGLDDSLRYFKYDYQEDWEFNTYFTQRMYYDPETKTVQEYEPGMVTNYYCWNSSTSKEINIYTTENISENIIKDHIVKVIPNTDRRISYLYAIEVHQKGLSKEAYKYWETLLKNNDGSSGIFAPQPNELRGNLSCVEDPEEMVLGYVGVSSVQKKRIFISSTDHLIYRTEHQCQQVTYEERLWDDMYKMGWDTVFYDEIEKAIYWAPRRCIDCRVYGNKNKPAFWPNDHQ